MINGSLSPEKVKDDIHQSRLLLQFGESYSIVTLQQHFMVTFSGIHLYYKYLEAVGFRITQ